jgi:hypothetical protein
MHTCVVMASIKHVQMPRFSWTVRALPPLKIIRIAAGAAHTACAVLYRPTRVSPSLVSRHLARAAHVQAAIATPAVAVSDHAPHPLHPSP